MPNQQTKYLTREVAQEYFRVCVEAFREGATRPGEHVQGTKRRAAHAVAGERLDIPRGSWNSRYDSCVRLMGRPPDWTGSLDLEKPRVKVRASGAAPLEFPTFPDEHPPANELIDRLCVDFERRKRSVEARKWYPVRVNLDGPVGIAWMGDPHVDDNGCNWPLLKRDCDLIARTEGMFGGNIGDSENNWAGRLAHLYSQQDTSRGTAKRLVEWLFSESGVRWAVLLLGNHDVWNGNADALTRIKTGGAPISDWSTQMRLVFPSGREARIWASHDFPGHSMWNPLHGAQKAAKFSGDADLYICGHKHNWACFATEDEHRKQVYWLARARGYKHIDDYADKLGFQSQSEGSTIVSIFDPDAETGSGFIHCYSDVAEAAEYLTWRRARWASNRRVAS